MDARYGTRVSSKSGSFRSALICLIRLSGARTVRSLTGEFVASVYSNNCTSCYYVLHAAFFLHNSASTLGCASFCARRSETSAWFFLPSTQILYCSVFVFFSSHRLRAKYARVTHSVWCALVFGLCRHAGWYCSVLCSEERISARATKARQFTAVFGNLFPRQLRAQSAARYESESIRWEREKPKGEA